MWRACSSNVLLTAPSVRPRARVRRERPVKIGPGGSREPNLCDSGAPRDMRDEWPIVQQAIAGNAFAQERLFAHHSDRLYRTAFSVLRNKEDAEDAVQDGLCKAHTGLRSFRGQSSFSTWLTRIVINSALMTRRRRAGRPEASLDETLEGQPRKFPVDERPDPEEICAAIEINALVERHTSQLPPLLRAAFRLRARSGFSTRESSQALGITTGAFKSRISRARRKLAQGLQQSLETKTARSRTKNEAIQ
jgi:RNA polymerase sigma-70 factor, ECF subfamily